MSTFTDLEKRILRILSERPGTPVDLLAEEAGCRKETIYRRLQNKPEFYAAFNDVLTMSVVGNIPAILNAFTQEALSGSFQHGKTLLEISGIYEKKQKVDARVSVRDEGPIFKSDREKWEFLKATLNEFEEEEDDND